MHGPGSWGGLGWQVGGETEVAHPAGSIKHERLIAIQILMTKKTVPMLRVRLLPQRYGDWQQAETMVMPWFKEDPSSQKHIPNQ